MKVLKNKLFITILSVIVLVIIFLSLLPKPIDMNLEQVGKGQPSVVFIYDPNLVVSNQQTTEINSAREITGEQVTFLVARVGDPNSENFRMRYNATAKDLLFFNRNGDLIDRKVALVSAEELIDTVSGR